MSEPFELGELIPAGIKTFAAKGMIAKEYILKSNHGALEKRL